jgi:hypothetical protein
MSSGAWQRYDLEEVRREAQEVLAEIHRIREGVEMSCQRCKKDRVCSISAKCSDGFSGYIGGKRCDGYVPSDMGISRSEDYVELKYCLDCGQIQGKFPLKPTVLEQGDEGEG